MKTKNLLILLLMSLSTHLFSQNIGLYSNITRSIIHTDRYENEGIFTSSVGLEYYGRESHLLKYTIGLSYEQKGQKFENNGYTYINIDYLELKILGRVGNSMLEGQFGIYGGFFTKANTQFLHHKNIGVTSAINQYLFSFNDFSTYIRGEVNYDISNAYSGDFFSATNFDRNFSYGLGFLLKWNRANPK